MKRPLVGLLGLLALQAFVFVLLAWTGSAQAWGVFAASNAEIADSFSGGVSPWDTYDGLVFGPMALALLEWPLLSLLGRSPWVHVLGMMAVALASTALCWAAVRRLCDERAAIFAAALVAFPPPNTWYHQHQGAYHLLGLLGLPLALILLTDAGATVRWRREIAAWTALFGALVLAPGGIGPAAALGAGLFLLRLRAHGRGAWIGLLPAITGAAIAALPVLYKGLIHVPFSGLARVTSKAAAGQTKPFFLGLPKLREVPGRLLHMLTSDLPYGMHYDSAGVPWVGGLLVSCAALAVVGLVVRARTDRGTARLLPVLLVPLAAVSVGLATGWFVVGRRAGMEPFPRDARHLLGLTYFGLWLLGIGLSRLRLPSLGVALAAFFALASLGTQVAALGPSRGVPFRLEARFLPGFFAGPVIGDQPEGAAAWCAEGPRSLDCLRGVAMAWGHRYAAGDYGLRGRSPKGGPSTTPQSLRADCAGLVRAAGDRSGALQHSCFFGLGFGFSDQAVRRLDRSQELCTWLELRPPERQACAQGAAWGQAQNFWNRPGVVRRWIDEQATGPYRVDSASGVGILVAMLGEDPAWVAQECAAQVPPGLVAACLEGVDWNQRFMPREER